MSASPADSAAKQARKLRETGSVQKLLETFGSIKSPDAAWSDHELVLEVARAHSLAGNEKEVERFFGRCVELNPRRAALYHCQVGWFYQRRKRWARAIDWYDSSLKTFGNYHLCLFRRGYCLERLHRPQDAAESLQSAVSTYENSSPEQQQRSRGIQIQALFHLSRNLREIDNLDGARNALESCSNLDNGPDIIIRHEHRLASRAEISISEGLPEEALRDLHAACELDGKSPVIWERLGRTYAALGNAESAEEALVRATSLPRGAVALVTLARYYRHEHRYLESAEKLVLALREHPRGELQIRLEMARLHLDLERPQAALKILKRLADGRVPPKSTIATTVRTTMAEIHAASGRRTAAIEELRVVVEQNLTNQKLQDKFDALVSLHASEGDEPAVEDDAPLPSRVEDILKDSTPRKFGEVLSYFPDRGFGFIAHGPTKETVFFHVSQCPEMEGTLPVPGMKVSFTIASNHRTGKEQAQDVLQTEELLANAATVSG